MENDLSLHQRILNAAASLEVENLKARHAYFHGRADASGEWSQIWSRSREASWAHVFGRMRGFDQIWYGSRKGSETFDGSIYTHAGYRYY